MKLISLITTGLILDLGYHSKIDSNLKMFLVENYYEMMHVKQESLFQLNLLIVKCEGRPYCIIVLYPHIFHFFLTEGISFKFIFHLKC